MRTLDAGFGNGAFSMYAARIGNEVIGISFSAEERDAARSRAERLGIEGITFRLLDLRDLTSQGADLGTFDQIICLETIEHLVDDERTVAELASMLRPGGRLLLTAPSADHRMLFGERISEVEDGGHVRWGYTPAGLREILHQAGLTPVHEGHVSGIVSQLVTDLIRRLHRFDHRLAWVLTVPLRALVIVDRPLTAAFGYPYLCVSAVGMRVAEPHA
jgi:SAM-dependent methyltransferase